MTGAKLAFTRLCDEAAYNECLRTLWDMDSIRTENDVLFDEGVDWSSFRAYAGTGTEGRSAYSLVQEEWVDETYYLSLSPSEIPDSEVTRDIIRLAGVPIAAPSANISGKPSTTTAQHVYDDHNGKIPLIVDGGPCQVGVESTIVDLTEARPRLLRPGGITPEQLLAVLGDLVVDNAVTAQIDKDAVVKAPGMKYKHYAPQAEVVIVAGSREKAAAYIHRHATAKDRVLCFEEELPLYADCNPLSYGREDCVETLSAGLFAALRKLDNPQIHKIYARCPEGGGVAYAVQNRLKKAAAFQIVDAEVEV